MTITRWEYSKQFSKYHFDPTINEDADPHFKLIGRVEGDLVSLYQEQLKKFDLKPYAILDGFINSPQTNRFTVDYDRAEIEYLNLDPTQVYFHNLTHRNNSVVQKIISSFKFKKITTASFHIQKPGSMFPFHIDELTGIKHKLGDKDASDQLDYSPQYAARFEIQILDWQPGHVWAYGNTYWKQWKSGDVVWHNWRDTPHGTCNIGRSDRVTLQITGLCSEETIEIINNNNYILKL